MHIIRENSIASIQCFNRITILSKSKINSEKYYDGIKTNYKYSQYNIWKTYDDGSTVLYNTLHDSVAVLSPQESKSFFSIENDNNVISNQLVDDLMSLGFINLDTSYETKILELQKSELLLNRGGIPTITILPTQACNARCEYCFAEHNQKITMTSDTIEKVVSFFIKNFKKGDKVLIRWFGGEPLVAKDIIDRIIEGINKAFEGELIYESIMFTNGSLLSEKTIIDATTNWHLKKVQITIDGYGDEHNRRKRYVDSNKDYYNKVIQDIRSLLNANIAVDARVNLDKDNICHLDSILEDLVEFKDNPSFRARLTVLRPSDCGYNKFNYITPEDLKWAYEIIYKKLFQYGFIKNITAIIPHRETESCILKNLNKVIIGADGNLYKCLQQVLNTEHSIGDIKSGINTMRFFDNCGLGLMHNECHSCKFYPICTGGCDAYWQLKETETISPCKREKYFIDLIFDFIFKWYKFGIINN